MLYGEQKRTDIPDKVDKVVVLPLGSMEQHGRHLPLLTDTMICQEIVRRVPVPPHVVDYVLDMVRRSRPGNREAFPFVKELIEWGPGPRACQYLVLGGKVRAILHGRYHVTVDDVKALAHPVLRHRIVPTFNAEAEGLTVDDIVDRILAALPETKENAVL